MLYSFGYNADGMRISKTVSDTQSASGETTYFVYNGSTLMGLRTGSNVMTFIHGADGEYLGFDYNGTKYYYVKNVQGDVVGLTDASGNIIAYYVYDAWGKPCYTRCLPANRAIADLNPIRYRGYYYDTDLGMYYLQSRYYDPKTGRFINADGYVSTGQGLQGNNMYAYCGNNPINRSDPSGTFWVTTILLTIGVVGLTCLTSCSSPKSAPKNRHQNQLKKPTPIQILLRILLHLRHRRY